jgi:hypothetical protein
MEPDCGKCGAILTDYIQNVTCGNSCRECGRYAYFAVEPSYLYLLSNPSLDLHKIGIGTVGKDKNRLKQLIQAGWIVHGLWHASEKRKTFQWEQAIFKELKAEIDSTTQGLVGRWDRDWVEGIGAQVISVEALGLLISKIITGKAK